MRGGGRPCCIRKSKCNASPNLSFAVCMQGTEKRERRRGSEDKLWISSYRSWMIIPLHLMGRLGSKTFKPFYWQGHWGLIRGSLEMFKVWSSWLPNSTAPKHCIILLLFGSECGVDRSCYGWIGVAAKWRSLKEEAHFLSSAYSGQLKSEETRRNSPHVESHLFSLFNLVKSPEDILGFEYLFFLQIHLLQLLKASNRGREIKTLLKLQEG